MKQLCIHGLLFGLMCSLALCGCADSAPLPQVAVGAEAQPIPLTPTPAGDDAIDAASADDSLHLALGNAASEEDLRVHGVIRYDGPPPERRVIDISRDKDCTKLHGDHPLHDEDMIVSEDGEVKNAFVYVKHRFKEEFPIPEEPAVLDQKHCMYTPRVQGIRAGQTLEIVNSDALTHNVRSFPTRNRPFNLGQIGVGTREKIFKRAEREVVEFRCDIHRWMLAYVFVLDHPFFAVTGDDGTYQIDGLPEGEYLLIAWHEEFGEQKQKIQVGADGIVEADFTFPAIDQ